MTQNINNTGAIIKEQIILGNIDNLNIDDLFNNTNNKKMNTQNYPTWLVPLDIAQQLNEIDFNEHCLFAFSTEKNDLYIIQRYKKNCVWYDDISLLYEPVVPTDSFLVPTWTEVFAWFRARGLYSYIRSYIAPENFYIYSIYDNNNFDKCCGRRDTYEEAQKECVKALIKTYKNELEKNNL